MPITFNLKRTSLDQRVCLNTTTKLGYIQQLNLILLSAINTMMQIFFQHTAHRRPKDLAPRSWLCFKPLKAAWHSRFPLHWVSSSLDNPIWWHSATWPSTFIWLCRKQHFPPLASVRLNGTTRNSYTLSPMTQVVSSPSAFVALTRQYLNRMSNFGKYFTPREQSNRLGSRGNGYLRLAVSLFRILRLIRRCEFLSFFFKERIEAPYRAYTGLLNHVVNNFFNYFRSSANSGGVVRWAFFAGAFASDGDFIPWSVILRIDKDLGQCFGITPRYFSWTHRVSLGTVPPNSPNAPSKITVDGGSS